MCCGQGQVTTFRAERNSGEGVLGLGEMESSSCPVCGAGSESLQSALGLQLVEPRFHVGAAGSLSLDFQVCEMGMMPAIQDNCKRRDCAHQVLCPKETRNGELSLLNPAEN